MIDIETVVELMGDDLKEMEFRQEFRDGIAELLHDDQVGGTGAELPTNLRTIKGCRLIADRIIKLVF